jgi:hypothetical protein
LVVESIPQKVCGKLGSTVSMTLVLETPLWANCVLETGMHVLAVGTVDRVNESTMQQEIRGVHSRAEWRKETVDADGPSRVLEGN